MTLSPTMAGLPRDRAAEEAVLDQVGRASVQLVDLQFSDVTGGAKSLTIPASLLAQTLAHGYRFDGAALTGGVRQQELDLFLMPDPATLAIFPPPGLTIPVDPGAPRRARLFCSVRGREGQPFPGDPRSTLQRTLETVAAAGFDYRVGIEIEYYLLRRDASDGALLPDQHGGAGYFDLGEDLTAAARDEIVATLHAVGVGIGGAHHETGPGQEELDLLPTGGIRMADQIMTVRQVIRSVAHRRGLRATFMPKPLAQAPGSGMHLVQRLARYPDGGDVLRAPESRDDLSPVARHMIAGQLAHAAAMCAVVCPTVNSYKRLAAGHRAPRYAYWARFGQAALVRVPTWSDDEDASIELRCPDAMANPYLVFAVVLACSLDGIAAAEEPPPKLDHNLVSLDDQEMAKQGVPRLPATLGDALNALAEDHILHEALGEYIFNLLLTVKRDEWEDYRRYVSPWEHARYADV